MEATAARRLDVPRRAHRRPLAFVLHSLFGLKLSLFVGFICLTGTIATVSHEIQWLVDPQLRATAVVGEEDWGRMWDAVNKARSDGRIESLGSLDRNNEGYFVRNASVSLPSGERVDVRVDPGTGTVTGEATGVSFYSFMRGLHYYLFAPGDAPFYIVSSMGVVILLSIITGLIVYKKFWRYFFRMPRWRRGLRTWLGDLHRLAGLWSLWFALIIGATCVWYILEHAGVDFETATPEAPAGGSVVRPPDGATVNRWVATARARMPGAAITGIGMPSAPGEPVTIQGQWRAWLVRERANAVYIDPASGQVIGARIAHEMGAGERFVHTADPLHFGNFAGLASKFVWVVFGLILTGMALSGAIIHARRTARFVRVRTNPRVLSSLDLLGPLKWPSIAAITVVPAVSFLSGWP